MRNMEKATKVFVTTLCSHLKEIHESIIKETGGLEGVRDEGGLFHSSWKIAEKLKNNEESIQIATFIFQELAKKHHFNDGNKRTAYCSVKEFLFVHGLHFQLEYRFAVDFITHIAKHNSPKTTREIKLWIKNNTHILETKDINSYLTYHYKDLEQMKETKK